MPTTQCKAHLQPIFKDRYYFGCKSALHFPLISFLFFFPPLKQNFLRHAQAIQTKDMQVDSLVLNMTEKHFIEQTIDSPSV